MVNLTDIMCLRVQMVSVKEKRQVINRWCNTNMRWDRSKAHWSVIQITTHFPIERRLEVTMTKYCMWERGWACRERRTEYGMPKVVSVFRIAAAWWFVDTNPFSTTPTTWYLLALLVCNYGPRTATFHLCDWSRHPRVLDHDQLSSSFRSSEARRLLASRKEQI